MPADPPGPARRGPRPGLPVRERARPDVSLAIVNIVLLLVFFFLLAGTQVAREIVALTPAETARLPLERLPRPLLVVPESSAGWTLEGAPVSPGTLAAQVAAGGVLHVLPAADVPADTLLGIVEAMGAAGVTVRLVTLHVRLEAGP